MVKIKQADYIQINYPIANIIAFLFLLNRFLINNSLKADSTGKSLAIYSIVNVTFAILNRNKQWTIISLK